ncbi:ChaN family lipoprotein [Nodosilinea sp. LEGE 07088]|nr:ChaN family lipoprotein [Nodosilinea sp. LEGE 07088]
MACSLAQTPAPMTAPMTMEVIEAADFAQDEAFGAIAAADVVYLGEHHDSAADHQAQLAIIQALYAENPDLAIAMEMFQRPFQPAIDRYLAGDISEAELVVQTEYEQRWGFDWEYYAPILRFAKAHQLPVLALNAPSETVRQVSREGLDSLEGDDLRYIPPLTDIDTSNSAYRAFVAEAFGSHSAHGSFDLDNFFAAQVLWDETMAATVAEFAQTSPSTQVVVLAGNGHVVYGYGIPDRVERRLGDAVQQVTVLLNFPPERLAVEADNIGDVLWYSE